MPTTTEATVRAFAHCRDARCPGYTQQEVDAVRREHAFTYGENGGDGIFSNFVERSTIAFVFADAADEPCPACGRNREVTGDPRPSYQPVSGHDPMGLVGGPKFDAGVVNTAADAAVAEMQAEMRKMRAEMDALRGGEPEESE